MSPQTRPTFLVLSQVYVPDPASVGQHMHHAAAEMAQRGWRVVVYTSRRGYDDPTQKYPWRETRDGVDIRRLPLSSFGKGSVLIRLIAGWLFVLQCMVLGLFARRLRCILVSTSPPFCPIAGVVIRLVRRKSRLKFWAMDLNPDQMIALGKITERSLQARVFEFLNRLTLRWSDDVVALDRFMAERLCRKLNVPQKIHVLPPWPVADQDASVAHPDNPFRREHHLEDKFVVMYSGNHSLAHPITTILQAAQQLRDEPRLIFMFIGGGLGKRQVDDLIAQQRPANIISLPYQPLDRIKYSLSAADLHLVVMGNEVVGINHPCKVYGALSLARPILFLGPRPSHVDDLIREAAVGWHVEHGDVDGAVRTIRQALSLPATSLAEMGQRAADMVAQRYTKARMCGQFADILERGTSAGDL
jgi:colanic acid biosynthesis glycosyl transferase WcaI